MASDEQVHFYGSAWLDRSAHLRGDHSWLQARLADARSMLVPVWRTRSLLHLGDAPTPVFLERPQVADEQLRSAFPVLLGRDEADTAWFALLFDDDEAPSGLGPDGARFTSLRRTGPLIDRTPAGVLAYARAMSNWHATHRYCGACGSPTEALDAGWLRRCPDPACGRQHFPRTDPAVIMRVTHGERILLGRQADWPPRWYSVLAGFVEPGESLEDAVRREIQEEVGIVVSDVRYDSSQPWPFPQSLMLGFSAEAEDDALECDGDELEDARWFTRDEIRAGHHAGELRLSPKASISRHLIDVWLDDEGPTGRT